MAERIHIDHGSFESGKRKMEQWKVPTTVKTELLRFLDDLGLGISVRHGPASTWQ